jgi:DMSO/TMAO reductase YedYZ heme-binding membrane subunit
VLNLAFGAVALDILLIVLASSLLIKRLPRKVWRRLHYGAYAVLALGLYHGLLIPNDFGPAARYATVAPLAFDKVLVELAIIGVLLASAWRIAAGVRRRAAPPAQRTRPHEGFRGVTVRSPPRSSPSKPSLSCPAQVFMIWVVAG